ncbi:MAG: hypothetical protein AAF420_09895 [Pseudomonadota bacterium]
MKTLMPVLTVMAVVYAPSALAAVDINALEEDLDVNPRESCADGLELYAEGDLKGALELITLCRDEVAMVNEQVASTAFVDQILDFVGDPIRNQNAMGFSQIERRYRNGDQDINVTLSTGQGATMMQSIVGVAGKKTRVGKHSGSIIAQGNETTLYISLDGMALSFQSRTVEAKSVKKFAKEFMKGVQ